MAVYYKKLIIDLWDYKITTVQTPKSTAHVENDHCLYCTKWQGADMSYQTDLNFRTQTVQRRFYWQQQRDININQVTFKQIITIAKGFSNSYPW